MECSGCFKEIQEEEEDVNVIRLNYPIRESELIYLCRSCYRVAKKERVI